MRHHVISVFGPFAASAAEAPPPFLWPPKECRLGHSVPFLLEAPRTAPASAQPPPPHLPPLPEPLLDRDHVPPIGVLEGAPAMEPQGPPVLGQVRTPSEAPASPRARLAGSVGESQIVPCTRRPSFRDRRGTEPLPFRGRLALLLCPTSAGATSTLPLSPARASLGAGGGRFLGAVCLPLLGTQAHLRAAGDHRAGARCVTTQRRCVHHGDGPASPALEHVTRFRPMVLSPEASPGCPLGGCCWAEGARWPVQVPHLPVPAGAWGLWHHCPEPRGAPSDLTRLVSQEHRPCFHSCERSDQSSQLCLDQTQAG